MPISNFFFYSSRDPRDLHSFPTRRSSDLPPRRGRQGGARGEDRRPGRAPALSRGRAESAREGAGALVAADWSARSEEHTSELQSQSNLVCRLLLEKKNICQRSDEAVVELL